MSPDEVLGLTEAARRLGLGGANSVASLIKHGDLRYVRGTYEPNPRKQGRVLVADVDRELKRGRGARTGG